MRLTEVHHKAARGIQRGDTIESIADSIGKDRRTIERWKKDKDFQSLQNYYSEVSLFAGKSRTIEEKTSELLQAVPEHEKPLIEKLSAIADKLGSILIRRLELAGEEEIEEIPLRLLAQWIGAYSSCVATIQAANDRLSSYEFLLAEVERILYAEENEQASSQK